MARKSNGLGPVEVDMSNGGANAKDGKPLTVGGYSFAKGLGVNADSEVVYKLNRMYDDFRATIGLDDEVPSNQGSVTYEVWVDGTLKYDSVMKRGNQAGGVIIEAMASMTFDVEFGRMQCRLPYALVF